MQSGDKIRDVSVGGAGNELNHRVSCLLIQQVNSIRAEINELLESLNSIDAAIGPTLLMLVTSSENSDSQVGIP